MQRNVLRYLSPTEKRCLKLLHGSWPRRQCRWGNSLLAVRGMTKRVTLHVRRRFQTLRERQQRGREVSGGGFTGQIPTAGVQQLHLGGGPPASLRHQNSMAQYSADSQVNGPVSHYYKSYEQLLPRGAKLYF